MPDHRRGYTRRGAAVLPPDAAMADAYRRNQREPAAAFDTPHQRLLITTARQTGRHLDARVRAVACEPTHAHVLVTWRHKRPWKPLRTSIRSALSRALNNAFGKRTWFADTPSRRRVRDHEHFDYLLLSYLPSHAGLCTRDRATVAAAQQRDARRPTSVTTRARNKRNHKSQRPR